VLLGHSLGGLIAASYALDGAPAPAFLVLSAPAVDSEISTVKRVMARLLGKVAPTRELDNGIRGDQLSHDPAVGERYFADPLVYPRTTLGMGRLALTAQASVRHRIHEIAQPTLVIHGGEDTLVPPPISVPFAAIPHVERIELPGLRHETFNEDGGAVAIGNVADWIERQVA
jgi:alpha-beta hydrolase superfamily lysophospholipase